MRVRMGKSRDSDLQTGRTYTYYTRHGMLSTYKKGGTYGPAFLFILSESLLPRE